MEETNHAIDCLDSLARVGFFLHTQLGLTISSTPRLYTILRSLFLHSCAARIPSKTSLSRLHNEQQLDCHQARRPQHPMLSILHHQNIRGLQQSETRRVAKEVTKIRRYQGRGTRVHWGIAFLVRPFRQVLVL